MASAELIGGAQDCLRRITPAVPHQVIRRGRSKTVLGKEFLWPNPIVLLDRAQHLSARHPAPVNCHSAQASARRCPAAGGLSHGLATGSDSETIAASHHGSCGEGLWVSHRSNVVEPLRESRPDESDWSSIWIPKKRPPGSAMTTLRGSPSCSRILATSSST